MSRHLAVHIVFFFAFVLIFTFGDHVVNSDLYGYGLQYSNGWAWNWWLFYFLCYESAIALLTYSLKSWRFLFFTEAFVLTSTQDLVFYAVWHGCRFPTCEWSWMLWQVAIFGTWTTLMQVALSFVVLSSVAAVCILSHRLKVMC